MLVIEMIYNLSYKEFSKLMFQFSKTVYGKCMFLINYSVFIFLFILTIVTFIMYLCCKWPIISIFMFILVLLTLISFVIGSYGFYKELRIFAEKR